MEKSNIRQKNMSTAYRQHLLGIIQILNCLLSHIAQKSNRDIMSLGKEGRKGTLVNCTSGKLTSQLLSIRSYCSPVAEAEVYQSRVARSLNY